MKLYFYIPVLVSFCLWAGFQAGFVIGKEKGQNLGFLERANLFESELRNTKKSCDERIHNCREDLYKCLFEGGKK